MVGPTMEATTEAAIPSATSEPPGRLAAHLPTTEVAILSSTSEPPGRRRGPGQEQSYGPRRRRAVSEAGDSGRHALLRPEENALRKNAHRKRCTTETKKSGATTKDWSLFVVVVGTLSTLCLHVCVMYCVRTGFEFSVWCAGPRPAYQTHGHIRVVHVTLVRVRWRLVRVRCTVALVGDSSTICRRCHRACGRQSFLPKRLPRTLQAVQETQQWLKAKTLTMKTSRVAVRGLGACWLGVHMTAI